MLFAGHATFSQALWFELGQVPDAHDTHCPAPLLSDTCPAPHIAHPTGEPAAANDPAVHVVTHAGPVVPAPVFVVPALQGRHEGLAVSLEYCPTAHGEHELAPVRYCPGPHFEHACAPLLEICPAGHAWHDAPLPPGEKLPDEHSEHDPVHDDPDPDHEMEPEWPLWQAQAGWPSEFSGQSTTSHSGTPGPVQSPNSHSDDDWPLSSKPELHEYATVSPWSLVPVTEPSGRVGSRQLSGVHEPVQALVPSHDNEPEVPWSHSHTPLKLTDA